MTHDWLQREVLITVKAYPNPSAKYHETVCVAAISREEGMLRLYPVQFRSMEDHSKFKKYQLVRMRIEKHPQDNRPESYRPDESSFELLDVVDSKNDWSERWNWIEPVMSRSMCEIRALQQTSRKSLGIFRPKKVLDFLIEDANATEWNSKQQSVIDQLTLFDSRTPEKLEKIPFIFKYRYICNDPNCNTHTQSIIDWEVMELYRNVRNSGADQAEIKQKIRNKMFDEICSADKDTCFFVGNHHKYPDSFMVLGAFWPPRRQRSQSLFAAFE